MPIKATPVFKPNNALPVLPKMGPIAYNPQNPQQKPLRPAEPSIFRPALPGGPPVYKPFSNSTRIAAPPVYGPHPTNPVSVQLKSAGHLKLETRPAPPVYRPQLSSSAGAQPKTAGNLRIETRPAPAVYKPQQASQNLQLKACHAGGTQQWTSAIATLARNYEQPKSQPLSTVIQRASSRKCPGCNGPVLPTGKCPRCKTLVETEKPVVKNKQKEERRKQKEKVEQRKEETAKKREIGLLGSKKGAVTAWEADKANFFEEFSGAVVANPPNTTPAKYPIKILDISTVSLKQPKLAKLLEDSLELIQVRPKTPEHRNDEGRFPGYDSAENPLAYWEFSYLGGGGRLVIDAIAGIIYISAHYSYNYKVVKDGVTPAGPVAVARETRRQTHFWQEEGWKLGKSSEDESPAEPEQGPVLATPVSPGLSLSPVPALSAPSFASLDDPVFTPPGPRYVSPYGAVGDQRTFGGVAPGYRLF